MRFSETATVDARARLLGERLAARRLDLNLTQSEVARRAGVSRDAVQRAERGRGTVDTLLRLIGVYRLETGLDLLLPEIEAGPAQLAATRRVPRRRARASGRSPSPPHPLWGDHA